MLSMRERREASPMTDNMCISSTSLMPMWRAMNSLWFSSWVKGAVEDINMV